MNLDYRLNLSLQDVPQSATVYQINPRKWTKDEVAALAKSLGITGAVSDQGGGAFAASGNGQLEVSPTLVQYVAARNAATPAAGSLPSNDAAVQAARSWLIQHNLVGGNVGSGAVVARDEAAKQVQVRIKPAEPENLLSATPSATVTVGPGGAILEASSRWPGSLQRSSYGLRAPEELWSAAKSGQGYIEVNPDALPSGALSGTATITGASLAYTIAGAPDGTQYLVPLVVFSGQANFGGGAVPIKIYVPAAGAQSAPRG